MVRTGQTEGSVDLSRLAGLDPSGIICEIMREDGTMARLPDLEEFAVEYGLKIATIADLIHYRLENDSLVHRVAEARLPTQYGGEFTAHVYTSDVDEAEHFVLVKARSTRMRPCSCDRTLSMCRETSLAIPLEYQRSPTAVYGHDRRSGKGVILYLRQGGQGEQLFRDTSRTDKHATKARSRQVRIRVPSCEIFGLWHWRPDFT